MTEIEYNKEIEYIFNRFPSYQKVGKVAYKPGIESMMELETLLNNPHTHFKSIHVAGTNGKGTVSHMMCAALMGANSNNKIGLYTSPHLLDFRERIKVNGEMIPREFVYNFVTKYKQDFERIGCSFFEITTAMAFSYFASCGVDYAVIECGLGGRLDSTNIITPLLSIITNIGLDHCEHLGYTYKEIATEKAGIIKHNVPVIIGSIGGKISDMSYVGDVFMKKAAEEKADLYYLKGEEEFDINNMLPHISNLAPDKSCNTSENSEKVYTLANRIYTTAQSEKFDLKGDAPQKNFRTVALALGVLLEREKTPYINSTEKLDAIIDNIYNTASITGLRGRWEKLQNEPEVRCDTGHNSHGFRIIGSQLAKIVESGRRLIIVMGVVADKDLDSIIPLLPKKAYYYFVNAQGSRALPAEILAQKMINAGFIGEGVCEKSKDKVIEDAKENKNKHKSLQSVNRGVDLALKRADRNDFVFIGGSTFVVAEALCCNFSTT